MTEEEYQAGVKSVRDKFKAEHGREMEFQDWVKLWGGSREGEQT